MGPGLYNLLMLAVLVGLVVVSITLGIDLGTRRGYGILGLALFAAAALVSGWASVIGDIVAEERRPPSGPAGLPLGFAIVVTWLITLFIVSYVSIAGLIEMAVARQWRWFAGLLAPFAVMVGQAVLGLLLTNPMLSQILPAPSDLRLPVSQIVYEGIPLLACFAYGIWRTWPRIRVAAR